MTKMTGIIRKMRKKTRFQARRLWRTGMALLLCVVSAGCILAGCGKREDIQYSGELDGLTWTIDSSGKLTVTGALETGLPEWGWNETETGRHWDFRNAPWYAYKDEVTSAVLSFGGAESLYGLLGDFPRLKEADLTGMDMSKVTNMDNMFGYDTNLETVTLKGCNLENAESMNNMFLRCESLSEADFSNVKTSSSLASLFGMFQGCSGLKTLDLSGFDTGGSPEMSFMFYQCAGMEEILVNGDWNTDSDAVQMFDQCGTDHVTTKK